jgi:two-component system chemotaxis family response regulator WspR
MPRATKWLMPEPDDANNHGAGSVVVPGDTSDIMVLLVDDQAIVGEAIRRVLAGQRGVNFHYCSDPTEAIEVAHEIKPTVILQDLVMPGVEGLTLVRQYRADPRTTNIPIIVLSTKEEAEVKSEAFTAGANDYLVKLPDNIELIARIRYHSQAYLNQIERDEAYQALHQSQRKLVETNIALQRLTNVDGLTGLNNRRYFDEFLAMQWKLAIREQKPISILMIDVDDFKGYNDTYGHLAGDEVLKLIAAAMQKTFKRPTDLTARFGGEEFVVILPTTPPSALRLLGNRLRQHVEGLNLVHTASRVGKCVTVSIGCASTIPQPGEFSVRCIGDADDALYEAKRSGKNQVVMHGQELGASSDSVNFRPG